MSGVICNFMGNSILEDYIYDPEWIDYATVIPRPTNAEITAIQASNAATAKVKLALHTQDPTVTGSDSYEVGGEGYARQAVGWSTPASRTTGNVEEVNFEDLPECTVTHIAVWTNTVPSQCLMTLELPTPLSVNQSDAINIPAHNLAFSL